MNMYRCCWGLLALSLALSAHAKDGPVGTVTLDVGASGAPRRTSAELWFEASPDAKVEDFTIRAPLRALRIARDAQPAAGVSRRPLVVLSHGNWGTRWSQGWLAMRLVRAGYVVLSTSHPGTLGDDQTAAGRLRLWDRTRDVTVALDRLLADARWSRLVDPDRIGFAGHSFGGWTGISLAGGRFDPARQRAHCEQARPRDFYCEGVLQDDVRAIPTADAQASYRDVRFKAFYLMATGPAQGFVEESLRAIDVPFMVDTAAFDEVLEPKANSGFAARRIAGAREVVRPAGHFAYVPACKAWIGGLMARAAGTPICDDPPGLDRSRVHDEVAAAVVGFFNAQLGATQPAR